MVVAKHSGEDGTYAGNSKRIRDFRVGEVYHVYQRGNHGKKTFLDPVSRVLYLQRLFKLARRHKVWVHNFCLMHNHVHFVFEPHKQDGISRLMQALQPHHAKQHNKKLSKSGNLWTQHFGCKHVSSEVYYRTVMKYVENNPVVMRRAGEAIAFQWSGAMVHATGQQTTLSAGDVTVTTELYLDGWRQRCADQIANGWVRFLIGRYEDEETLKKIQAMVDGRLQQQLAQQDRLKKSEAKPVATTNPVRKAKRRSQEHSSDASDTISGIKNKKSTGRAHVPRSLRNLPNTSGRADASDLGTKSKPSDFKRGAG